MGGAKQEGPTLNPNLTPELTADSLSQFPLDERRKLQAAVLDPSFDGVLSADVVQDLLLSEGGPRNIQELMLALLPLAQLFALPPTSEYRVGVVCQGRTGALYLGANLEIAGESLGFTVHGEQSAIINALVQGEREVGRLAATAAPCGHCRQFLNGLGNS